jgi:non-specific serine/threonine protein kinase/protein-serine/threonine kinase
MVGQIIPREGLTVDGFVLGPLLHRGGFATIWEVTHPDHAEPMVMKVPTILDGDDAPTIVGFEVEQMIAPRLAGPHVARVIATGDFAVLPYIVTERIDGGSLLARFDGAPKPVDEVIETAARIAQAVHDLHRQHVIHLDLKPANVLQRATGEMVLIDLGLARHDHLPDLLAEEFAIPMGTWPYIAPEQVLRERRDPRSDLFALGAMAYEFATGVKPFGEPASLRQVRRRLWTDPDPPRRLRPDLPEWLQEILLRALEVDPARRYQSAAQMQFDLTSPAQVAVTARGRKTRVDGYGAVFARWRRMRRLARFPDPPDTIAQTIAKGTVLMVAVDLAPEMEALADRLRLSVQRMLTLEPEARVACVNVLRTPRIGLEQARDAEGNHVHVQRLVQLKAWAEGLDLPPEKVTATVLEDPDPAAALVAHAGVLQADHILIGARASGATRRYLGSVSAKVVAEADCSVTVIRLRQPGAPDG